MARVLVIDDDEETRTLVKHTLTGSGHTVEEAADGRQGLQAFGKRRPDLVINTSCEHIADLRGWLDLLPVGMPVVLQSNDYFSDPEHINCVRSLEEFEIQANLSKVAFHGTLGMTKYSRFMLIGYR